MTDLDKEILEVINSAIGAPGQYIGRLSVRHYPDEDLWELRLYMDCEDSPMGMAYQGSYEAFKDFIYKEIRTRKMERVTFWQAIQELPSPVCKDGELVLDWDDALIT